MCQKQTNQADCRDIASIARQRLLLGKRLVGDFDPEEYKHLLEKEIKALKLNAEVDMWTDAQYAPLTITNKDTGERFHINDIENHAGLDLCAVQETNRKVLPRERVEIYSPARKTMLSTKKEKGTISSEGTSSVSADMGAQFRYLRFFRVIFYFCACVRVLAFFCVPSEYLVMLETEQKALELNAEVVMWENEALQEEEEEEEERIHALCTKYPSEFEEFNHDKEKLKRQFAEKSQEGTILECGRVAPEVPQMRGFESSEQTNGLETLHCKFSHHRLAKFALYHEDFKPPPQAVEHESR